VVTGVTGVIMQILHWRDLDALDFDCSDRVQGLQKQMRDFLDDHILPANAEWQRIAESGEHPELLISD